MDGTCPGFENKVPDQALLIQGSSGVTRGGEYYIILYYILHNTILYYTIYYNIL